MDRFDNIGFRSLDGSRASVEQLLHLADDRLLQELQLGFDELHHCVADREIGHQWTGKNRVQIERQALMVANMIATLRKLIKDAGGVS